MPPVISTIVMLRLFARRQRASMSAYFTNSLTAPTGFGLLASLRGGALSRSGSAWPGRSQKDGLPFLAAGDMVFSLAVQGHQLAHWGGAAWSLPLSNRGRNGRQDARSCFAHLHVALLRRRRLDFGLHYFGFGLFCARRSRRCRHSRKALALTWTKTISRSSAPQQPRARPASGGTTTTM